MKKIVFLICLSLSLIGCSPTEQDGKEESIDAKSKEQGMNKEITINTGEEDFELEPVYTCNENCTLKDDLKMVDENFNSYGVPEINTQEILKIDQGEISVDSSGAMVHYASTTQQVNLREDYSLPVLGNKGKSSKYIYYKQYNTEGKQTEYDIYAFTVVPN